MTEVARLDYQELITRALVPVEKVYQLRNGEEGEQKGGCTLGTYSWRHLADERSIDFLLNFPDIYGFLSLQRNGDPESASARAKVNRIFRADRRVGGRLELPAVRFRWGMWCG